MDGKPIQERMPVPLLTTKEAAMILRVSERSLWTLTSPRGPIRAVRMGRSVRYSPQVIEDYIQGRLGTPPTLAA